MNCSLCAEPAVAVCGTCLRTPYCSDSCQKLDHAQHSGKVCGALDWKRAESHIEGHIPMDVLMLILNPSDATLQELMKTRQISPEVARRIEENDATWARLYLEAFGMERQMEAVWKRTFHSLEQYRDYTDFRIMPMFVVNEEQFLYYLARFARRFFSLPELWEMLRDAVAKFLNIEDSQTFLVQLSRSVTSFDHIRSEFPIRIPEYYGGWARLPITSILAHISVQHLLFWVRKARQIREEDLAYFSIEMERITVRALANDYLADPQRLRQSVPNWAEFRVPRRGFFAYFQSLWRRLPHVWEESKHITPEKQVLSYALDGKQGDVLVIRRRSDKAVGFRIDEKASHRRSPLAQYFQLRTHPQRPRAIDIYLALPNKMPQLLIGFYPHSLGPEILTEQGLLKVYKDQLDILVDDGGPEFVYQRIGPDGEPFRMVPFFLHSSLSHDKHIRTHIN